MERLIFVTGNPGKASEASTILDIPIDIQSVELDEIQSTDLEIVVRKKAQDAFAVIQKPLIVDDVGFFVEAWNGFPGPFIKYLLETSQDNRAILKMLENEKNRRVVIKCGIGYHDGQRVHTFLGEVTGTIPLEEKGQNGFGFDSIFILDGLGLTWAEMSPEEKNKVSHRGVALTQLKTFLSI